MYNSHTSTNDRTSSPPRAARAAGDVHFLNTFHGLSRNDIPRPCAYPSAAERQSTDAARNTQETSTPVGEHHYGKQHFVEGFRIKAFYHDCRTRGPLEF